MVKKILVALFLACAVGQMAGGQQMPHPDSVVKIMKRVADWQVQSFERKHTPETNWENGALYVGMAHWAALHYRLTGKKRYYDWLKGIGQRMHWQPGGRMYHADDLTVTQTWMDLADFYKKEEWYYPTMARLDFVTSHPAQTSLDLRLKERNRFDRWSWCDALFMAPPSYLRMYLKTKDKKYLKFMENEYRATTDFLFDKDENLFFRDARYMDMKERNGEKIFWGRGNGWVLAGLAETQRLYPQNKRQRKYYEFLFCKMSSRLKDLQQPDGYWHASLLDPQSYPSPETSATGFIAFGLAYGINAGILSKEEYLPVVLRAWKAMVDAVEPNGKLGYVQPIGADPQKVTRDMTEVYGVGAILALGCEVYQLAGGK